MPVEQPPRLKGKLPFTLSTTSFIYPDTYANNVRRLGALVDEIELLFFEKDSLPSETEIRELKALAAEHNLSFNIHLPLDIHLTIESASLQALAVDTLLQIFELTAPLSPSTHTLHLPYSPQNASEAEVTQWQQVALTGLQRLMDRGILKDSLSLETLDYPFEWLHPLVSATGIPVCLDVGHILSRGFDLGAALQLFENCITIMHLHGVQNRVDHLGLDKFDCQFIAPVLQMLGDFTGIVSLEVFCLEDLLGSMRFLKKHFHLNHP